MKRECSINDCTNAAHTRTWCKKHYARWRRWGHPQGAPPKREDQHEANFWRRIDSSQADGCWPWMGPRNASGYGKASFPSWDRRTTGNAHQVAYLYTHGSLPEGMHIDHICNNRPCCNPAHLRPLTPRENALRSTGITAQLAVRKKCDKGHPFSGANLAIRKDGTRKCRTCHAEYMRAYRRRRNA